MQVWFLFLYFDEKKCRRRMVARAAHKAVLCATIRRTEWQKQCYPSCISRVSFVYLS